MQKLFPFTLFTLLVAGCGEDLPTFEYPPDRAEGTRAPITAPCGDPEEIRCLLPWPSSSFLKADEKTATGVRLAVEASSLPAPDDTTSLGLADGFSRVTPIAFGFIADIDPATLGKDGDNPVKLILAQHDHPRRGEIVPTRLSILPGDDGSEALLLAYPLRPLEPNADYVAVVMTDIRPKGGGYFPQTRQTLASLEVIAPKTQRDADLVSYHAPTRKALRDAGIDLLKVYELTEFTTRSGDDATKRLTAMRNAEIDAVDKGAVTIAIDKVEYPTSTAVAAIVEGRMQNLPSFLDAEGDLSLDGQGNVVEAGKREAPFRVMIPAGEGDYRFVMWGHGMGGEYDDDSFDEILGAKGVGKVGIRFYGWTGDQVIGTFASIVRMAEGTHRSTAGLMHAVSDGSAIQRAMSTLLGDLLSAPMLKGAANPLAGRRPDTSVSVWAGGSLGGTMGLVYASVDPDMHYAVLNVPGAGWSHFVPGSQTYSTVRGLLQTTWGTALDVGLALAQSQSNWDEVDGAIWADRFPDEKSVYCIQESIGDPILPNEGTAMVSVATGAVQLGSVISPIVGVDSAKDAIGTTALTQFKVSTTDALDIHGFAAKSGPAGDAAREQMTGFVQSVWDGKPTITLPSGCAGGSCDFSAK